MAAAGLRRKVAPAGRVTHELAGFTTATDLLTSVRGATTAVFIGLVAAEINNTSLPVVNIAPRAGPV